MPASNPPPVFVILSFLDVAENQNKSFSFITIKSSFFIIDAASDLILKGLNSILNYQQ